MDLLSPDTAHFHIIKGKIVDPGLSTSADHGRQIECAADVAERNVADLFCRRFRSGTAHLAGNKKHPVHIHLQILKTDIFDLYSAGGIGTVIRVETDRIPAIVENDVGNIDIADDPVADPEAECHRPGMQHAVGDGGIFTWPGIFQPITITAEGDAVITGINDTVGNNDPPAAVDIQTVAVGGALIVQDPETADEYIFAAV